MKTVIEVSRLTGVSVRTLHHYDAIGLLKPSEVTDAGYRLYDDTALERLQTILLFRELQFPLKEIRQIIDSPDFDRYDALDTQIKLLEMQRERLGRIISFAREIKEKGVMNMNFKAFDKAKIKEYSAQAREKWGNTQAYKEFEEKSADKNDTQIQAESDGLMQIFVRFGKIMDKSPECDDAQALVSELQTFITEHYYTCTKEILAGLGQMYAAEGEMKQNIDSAGGIGTADFAASAIEIFCK